MKLAVFELYFTLDEFTEIPSLSLIGPFLAYRHVTGAIRALLLNHTHFFNFLIIFFFRNQNWLLHNIVVRTGFRTIIALQISITDFENSILKISGSY